MGIFEKMKEPVFLKQSNIAKEQLEKMKLLREQLNAEGQKLIDRDIQCLEYGIIGEENIIFELKNSHIPMYILHDIRIGNDDLAAQIDYIIVTRKLIFFVECKNLYGDIEINNRGDFIRTVYYGNKPVREGIYSPITQNKRHMELYKQLVMEQKNRLMAFAFDKWFDDNHKSIIVLANPKTVINMKYAKKEIKEQVIRGDQLINYIKEENKKCDNPKSNDKQLLEIAENILRLHKESEKDYTEKYKKYMMNDMSCADEENVGDDADLYGVLKDYRLNKSREENIKAYFIFNNEQLNELVSKKPKSVEDLMLISGFGKVKVEKYGIDIIDIIKNVNAKIEVNYEQ